MLPYLVPDSARESNLQQTSNLFLGSISAYVEEDGSLHIVFFFCLLSFFYHPPWPIEGEEGDKSKLFVSYPVYFVQMLMMHSILPSPVMYSIHMFINLYFVSTINHCYRCCCCNGVGSMTKSYSKSNVTNRH